MTDVYVVGVDPGASTGIFVVRNGERFAAFQGTQSAALATLTSLLRRARRDDASLVVGCERYVSGTGGVRTYQSVPQQVIGQVVGLVQSFGYHTVLQAPADAKRVGSNELLRRLGFHVTRAEVNQRDANDVNDAARHAVLLLAGRYATVLERLLNAQP